MSKGRTKCRVHFCGAGILVMSTDFLECDKLPQQAKTPVNQALARCDNLSHCHLMQWKIRLRPENDSFSMIYREIKFSRQL